MDFIILSVVLLLGMKIKYNLKKEPGHRVASVEVLCTACEIPDYEPLDKEKVYSVVMQSFLSGGGDGFTMISDNIIKIVSGKSKDSSCRVYPISRGWGRESDRRLRMVEDTPQSFGLRGCIRFVPYLVNDSSILLICFSKRHVLLPSLFI